MVYIGCHLSSTKGFEHMGKEALSIGADTFAFFTRNPRGGKAKEIDEDDAHRLMQLIKANNFGKLVAHAPYTLNPCSKDKKVREFANMVMKEDLLRMEYLPGNYYNFHPGSHVGQGADEGIAMTACLLNNVLFEEQNTIVLLETMAGKGTEIGKSFEEIASIIQRVDLKEKIGVCFDTCHVSDAGYDIVKSFDDVLEQFDRIIGLKYLKALHINDSMNPCGAHKDRHAKIGEGMIGAEAIINIAGHDAVKNMPCILETPNNLEGYAKEIELIRKNV